MVPEADISALVRLWHDSWLALPVLGLVALLSLRLAKDSNWTVTATVVRLVGLALLIPAALTVLVRSGALDMDVYTNAFAYVGLAGAATAAMFAATATRLGRLDAPDAGIGANAGGSLFAWKLGGGDKASKLEDRPGTTMAINLDAPGKAWLLVRKGAEPGSVFDLEQDIISMGRDSKCDIALKDQSTEKKHAIIRRRDGQFLLYDLGTEAGTLVNKRAVETHFLKNGTTISVGRTEMFFTGVEEVDSGPRDPGGVILISSGPDAGAKFALGEDDVTIGRDPGKGGVKVPDATVSKQHAVVRWSCLGHYVQDMGSSNGTTVDGNPVTGAALTNGDIITMGDSELQFVREAA
jgi:pSer/pThr/pTyr-binding forkhead associated (FHA) protein